MRSSRTIAHWYYAVLDLGKEVKASIERLGYLAWQYNTVGVSDGITQGNEGEV